METYGVKIIDGKEVTDSDNDKHRIYCKFVKLNEIYWNEIELHLHLSHGYYGSSSGYSDTSKEMGEYVARVITSIGQMILQKAVQLAEADTEKARKDAEEEAKMVLQQTKELMEKVVLELSNIPIVDHSVQKVGASRATLYRWMKEDPTFARKVRGAIKVGISHINDFSESKLMKKIQAENLYAIMFWLRTHHPDYKEKK